MARGTDGAAALRFQAKVRIPPGKKPDFAELEVWQGNRCVLAAEIDDELPAAARIKIANELARLINAGRQP